MSARREPRKKKDRNYSRKKETGLQATDPHHDVGLLKELLDDLRTLIEEARTRVATAVNLETVMLNWRIGQRIWREILGEERAEYGKRIVYALSRQLTVDLMKFDQEIAGKLERLSP